MKVAREERTPLLRTGRRSVMPRLTWSANHPAISNHGNDHRTRRCKLGPGEKVQDETRGVHTGGLPGEGGEPLAAQGAQRSALRASPAAGFSKVKWCSIFAAENLYIYIRCKCRVQTWLNAINLPTRCHTDPTRVVQRSHHQTGAFAGYWRRWSPRVSRVSDGRARPPAGRVVPPHTNVLPPRPRTHLKGPPTENRISTDSTSRSVGNARNRCIFWGCWAATGNLGRPLILRLVLGQTSLSSP